MADNRLLAEIARKGGGKLLNRAVDKVLPVEVAAKPARKSLLGRIAGAMVVRVASRSVPGAIVVGGSLLAKRLYDRRHAKRSSGEQTPEKGSDKT